MYCGKLWGCSTNFVNLYCGRLWGCSANFVNTWFSRLHFLKLILIVTIMQYKYVHFSLLNAQVENTFNLFHKISPFILQFRLLTEILKCIKIIWYYMSRWCRFKNDRVITLEISASLSFQLHILWYLQMFFLRYIISITLHSAIFPFLFLSIGSYCGAGIFVLIGCTLSPNLALPTSFDNNNNHNNKIGVLFVLLQPQCCL